MSDEKPTQEKEPFHVWLPPLILKLLVFAALFFVLYQVLEGQGGQPLDAGRVVVIIVDMALMLLLIVVDRLVKLRVTQEGVEAELAQAQAKALQEIGALDDREAVDEAQAKILEAKDPKQVQAAVAQAVELNVTRLVQRVEEAIRQKRRLFVNYRPEPEAPIQA